MAYEFVALAIFSNANSKSIIITNFTACTKTRRSVKIVLNVVSFVTASEIVPSQSIKQNFLTILEVLDAIYSDALNLQS